MVALIMIVLTACHSESDDPQPSRKNQQTENRDLLEVIGAVED